MFSEEYLYSIALAKCKNIGNINFKKLVELLGSAENVWKEGKMVFSSLKGKAKNNTDIGNEEYLRLAENEIENCQKENIKILLSHRNELPFLLGECLDAPVILYQKGNFDSLRKPISIVGTRNMTAYGKNFVEEFLQELAPYDFTTVSGLAYGVDTQVHQSSLDNSVPTLVVLAHGLHDVYPKKNKKLAEKILENQGALFSEFAYGKNPAREFFLQRNRIVAGMSSHLIVVETAFGGGSVSTVNYAQGYHRDVFALPGRITDIYSQGCNHLIYNNKAAAISNLEDLKKELNILPTQSNFEKKKNQNNENSSSVLAEMFPKEPSISLNLEQRKIYDCILARPKISLDEMCDILQISTSDALPILLELELFGVIQSFSGRQFQVI